MGQAHDVVVIGAGQGGLSTSYWLTNAGIDHAILDRGGVAHAWRAQRWDSFCLVTPNWTIRLPGAVYDGDDPHGFMHRDEFVAYMDRWAAGFNAPVHAGVDVISLQKGRDGFDLRTDAMDTWHARAVVVATATYQHARIPAVADALPGDICALHAVRYKRAADLPPGAVLVVGSGQTGCQIVDDLIRDGRQVYLAVGHAGRLPRRYRGRDCIEWQRDMKLLDRTPDMLENRQQRFAGDPHVSGRDGGKTLSLHAFHQQGVTLLGRLQAVSERDLQFSPTLAKEMHWADEYAAQFYKRIDDYIEQQNLSIPPATTLELFGGPPGPDWSIPETETLSLDDTGIRSVVWATGFDYDFSWIDCPVLDEFGYPDTQRGVTGTPGLYFCGLNWMHQRKSGILYGVGEDARHVAQHLTDFLISDTTAANLPGQS